jgi:hypothetical protein
MTNDIPYIEEITQKTFESEPLTKEELSELKLNLYSDDIDGGLQNVKLTDDEIEEINLIDEKSQEFMEINDEMTNVPYLSDIIKLKLSPESLLIVIEILKQFSINMKNIEYLENESKCGCDIYEQQTRVRMLVEELDSQLDTYIKNRPYSPFFVNWVDHIGRSHREKI